MESLIRQIENWQAKSPSEILVYFQESVSQNITEDYTVAKLINLLGEDNARIVVGTIQQAAAVDPLMGPTLNALSVAPGIQLYTDDRQAGIDQLAVFASWPNELTQAVKALGRRMLTRWENNAGPGNPEPPTVEQIAETVAAMKVIDAKALVRAWRDEVLLPLVDSLTNEGKTIEEIKALIVS